MRRALDATYDAAAYLAALLLIGTLVMVLLGIFGRLLDFQVRDLHIECLPNAIPDVINVDISNLGLHQYVRISELGLPQGVKVLDDPDRVVVGVTHQKAEVVETPEVVAGVEAVPAEPEVIARGKKPEEEPAE